jgi:hypothetical protein
MGREGSSEARGATGTQLRSQIYGWEGCSCCGDSVGVAAAAGLLGDGLTSVAFSTPLLVVAGSAAGASAARRGSKTGKVGHISGGTGIRDGMCPL